MPWAILCNRFARQAPLLAVVIVWLGCSSPYYVGSETTDAEVGGASKGGKGSAGAKPNGGNAGSNFARGGSGNAAGSNGAGTSPLSLGGAADSGGTSGEGGIGTLGGSDGLGGTIQLGGAAGASGGMLASGGRAITSGGTTSAAGSIGKGGTISSGGAVTSAGTPNGGAPKGGAPSGGAPSGGAPSGGAPSGGAPSGGAPSGGAPSGGAPSGGAPSGGAPSGGTGGVCSGSYAFCDDFENGTSKWTVTQGSWSVVADGTNVYQCALSTVNEARSCAGLSTWTDYTVTARMKLNNVPSPRRVYLAARYVDASNWYGAGFSPDSPTIQIRKKIGGSSSALAEGTFAWSATQWYKVALKVSGNVITMYIDGTQVLTGTDAVSSFPAGQIALLGDRSQVSFDDVTVTIP